MPFPGNWPPAPFDESHWLANQARRGRWLHDEAARRLEETVADPVMRGRMAARLLRGEPGQVDSPVSFAVCLAESLGLASEKISAVAVGCALFWAAADTADDLDDHDVSGGLHPAETPASANDACALLLLCMETLLRHHPAAAGAAAQFGLRMARGQTHDLASTDRPTAPDVFALARDKAGAEIALFFSLMAREAGADPAAFAQLGEAYGTALQLFSDLADLYVKPVSDDFTAGKWTLALFHYQADPIQTPALWRALDRTRPDVQARVRFEAAQAALRSLEGVSRTVIDRWAALRESCPRPAPFDEAVAWLDATLQTVESAVRELDEPGPPSVWSSRQAVSAGARYLAAHDFAEEHRWGLFDKPLVRGDLFSTLWRAAALRQADADWEPQWRLLLDLRDEDGWRYFPHQREIPPDADDAGLLLGYFGDVMSAGLREATARQLIANFESESIHTWMAKAEGTIAWEGDDCPATLANAVWGLTLAGHGRQVPRGAWRRLIALAAENRFESPFYVPAPTRFFVHRALAAAVTHGELTPYDAGEAQRRLEIDLMAAERLAGNYHDEPFDCACAVLAAAAWGLQARPWVAHWLADRQQIDGAWPAVPVFRTPGIHLRPYIWGHEGLTTCFVVLALLSLSK